MSTDPCSWESMCKTAEVDTSYTSSEGPVSWKHEIRTDYTLEISGTIVPLVRTTRDFNVSFSTQHSAPSGRLVAYLTDILGYWSTLIKRCGVTSASSNPSLTVNDTCVIEKSTLHYLDQRYGVCLYRFQKDELRLDITSAELAAFKTSQGTENYHQAQIKSGHYQAASTEEWRLVIDGSMQVLTKAVTVLHPFGGKNSGEAHATGLAAGWSPDPDTRLILVFPQPPSKATPISNEVVRLGFYDYGNLPGGESELNRADGGYKDMFYPEWCRNLQEDPFWKAAAERRYMISWFHDQPVTTSGYEPPPVSVEPIPIGSFARHPEVGDVYQFLINNQPVTSHDLRALIDNALPAGLATRDTTLYYPISLI